MEFGDMTIRQAFWACKSQNCEDCQFGGENGHCWNPVIVGILKYLDTEVNV